MPSMRISGESKYNRHSSVEPPNERAQIDPGGPVLQALGACDWLTPVGQEAPSNAQGTRLNHEELSSTLTIASRSRLATFSSSPLPPFSVFPSFSSHPLHSFPSQVPASLFQRLTLQSILSLTYSLSFRPFALFFDTIPWPIFARTFHQYLLPRINSETFLGIWNRRSRYIAVDFQSYNSQTRHRKSNHRQPTPHNRQSTIDNQQDEQSIPPHCCSRW